MNIVDINNEYKTELILAVQSGKLQKFTKIYFEKMKELIFLLQIINGNFIIYYLFLCQFLCQFLCLQIDLYNKYSFLIRMVPSLKFL